MRWSIFLVCLLHLHIGRNKQNITRPLQVCILMLPFDTLSYILYSGFFFRVIHYLEIRRKCILLFFFTQGTPVTIKITFSKWQRLGPVNANSSSVRYKLFTLPSTFFCVAADKFDRDPRSDQRDGSVSLQPPSQLHCPHHLQRGALRRHGHGLLWSRPRHLPQPGRPATAAHCPVQLQVA